MTGVAIRGYSPFTEFTLSLLTESINVDGGSSDRKVRPHRSLRHHRSPRVIVSVNTMISMGVGSAADGTGVHRRNNTVNNQSLSTVGQFYNPIVEIHGFIDFGGRDDRPASPLGSLSLER